MSLGCLWVYLHIPRLLSATHVLDRRELSASERGAVPWMKCRTAFAAANRRWRKRGVSDSEWRWRGGCGSGRRHQTFSLLLRLLLSLRSVVQPEPKSQHRLCLATTFPFSDKSQKPNHGGHAEGRLWSLSSYLEGLYPIGGKCRCFSKCYCSQVEVYPSPRSSSCGRSSSSSPTR